MEQTILVVDDEREIADLVEVYLKNEGFPVLKAYTAAEALEIPFYKRLSSREVYVISKELEKRKVQYSAVIRQDGEGQITVGWSSEARLRSVL